MSRDDGFAVADTATGLHQDPKVKKLWRVCQNEAAMNAAMVLYEAIRLASWATGERVSAEDAAPMWLADCSGATAALQQAGLLDTAALIPSHAWASWYDPAVERREQRREAGRLGGATAALNRRSSGATSGAIPVRPSVPTDKPSVPRSNGAYAPVTEEQNEQAIARLSAGEFTTYGEALEAVRAGK